MVILPESPEDHRSNLEDKRAKTPNQNSKKKKSTENEVILRNFWDKIKSINNHIIKLAEEEERSYPLNQTIVT